jgi:hypothetical protein
MLARLDETFFKSLQLSWDAINHDWRRNVIGFNFDRQRSLWREWKLSVLAPWQITAIVAAIATAWVGALWAQLAWRRRQDRARALWDSMCVRLARAGLPRAAHEGPLDYAARAAARWPQFTKAFRVIGDSYAELRYGPVAARTDTNLERASALWRLRRAVRMPARDPAQVGGGDGLARCDPVRASGAPGRPKGCHLPPRSVTANAVTWGPFITARVAMEPPAFQARARLLAPPPGSARTRSRVPDPRASSSNGFTSFSRSGARSPCAAAR